MAAETRLVARRTIALVSLLGILGGSYLVGSTLPPAGAAAVDPAALVGQWSGEIDIGAIGVAAAQLHTGKVLLWESREGGIGSRAALFDPKTLTAQDVSIPYARNAFCAGNSFLPDGRLLVAGGDPPTHSGTGDINLGTNQVSIFDPVTQTWSEKHKMAFARWYPSNVSLANGKTLVFSGNNENGIRVTTVERFNPPTNTWTTLPRTANQDIGLYPRTLLLPSGKIMVAGKLKNTKIFDPATDTWAKAGSFNFGQRKEGSAVLLPGLTKVLAVGGMTTAGVVTDTAEIYNLKAPSPHWTYTGSMANARINENLVILDDGTVLAVGGGRGTAFGNPVKEAELYNPATGTWKAMASQTANRTYHSTALLLPDGRVLSAGSTNHLPEETTVELYSPPYLFKGARPTITAVHSHIGYGASFNITTPDAASISRVALIRPGSVTHAVNFDQRYVNLKFSHRSGMVTATAPRSGNVAPPGYYMLVVLTAGVPSVAKFVQLT